MRSQESSPPVRVLYMCTALGTLWVMSKIGVEWNQSVQGQKRRLEEARYTVQVCSSDTKNLFSEFIKCENAHMSLGSDATVGFLRAIERTIRVVSMDIAGDVTKLSFQSIGALISIAGALGLLGATCNFVSRHLDAADDMNFLSPMARHRESLQDSAGPIVSLSMKKNF